MQDLKKEAEELAQENSRLRAELEDVTDKVGTHFLGKNSFPGQLDIFFFLPCQSSFWRILWRN